MTERSNPFVGLRPFTIEDSLLFFGREEQTAGLLEILHHPPRFLGVVGSSGSGKSSLVRAGLLPALLGGFLVEDRDHWKIVQVKPGDEPIKNLATGLIEAFADMTTGLQHGALEQGIRDKQADAVLEFLTPFDARTSVFILVDQFEEIFAFRRRGTIAGSGEADGDLAVTKVYAASVGHDDARAKQAVLAADAVLSGEIARRSTEASDFVATILALAEQEELPVYVALTMRTDFLGDCDLFYGLPEALNRGQYLVPRLTRRQLQRAIEGPIKLAGTQIAPRLLDHVLNELGDRSDRLPVLQHALLRTWERWAAPPDGESGAIDLPHFMNIGGLESALHEDAEVAARNLDARVVERFFRRLTSTDVSGRRVRSPARISELMKVTGADRATINEVIGHFVERGRNFVYSSADGRPDDPMVDISHESLIRQWKTLRKWVDQERNARDEYFHLVERARNWEGEVAKAHGLTAHDGAAPLRTAESNPDEWLLRNPDLPRFTTWRQVEAPSEAWAARYGGQEGDFRLAMRYLDASETTRARSVAEERVLRRWATRWRPWLTTFEILSLIVFAMSVELLAVREGVGQWLTQSLGVTLDENGAQEAHFAAHVARVLDILLSWQFAGTLVVAALCLFLNHRLQELYRRRQLPLMLTAITEVQRRRPEPLLEPPEILHTQYASAWSRFSGGCRDGVIGFVRCIVCIIALLLLTANVPVIGFDFSVLAAVASFLAWGWLRAAHKLSSARQATRGMRAAGIFATDLRGGRLTFKRALAWSALRVLSMIPYYLGFVTQLFTARRQTMHDWLAGVVVLKRPPEYTPSGDS